MENGNGRAIKQQSIHSLENPRGSQVNPVGHLYWTERLKFNCATIYGKHGSYLMSCRRRMKITEYICQRADKHERGWCFCVEESVLKDQ